jgi:LysM repeat protein
MFDDERDDYGFWADEPTRPLERITARRKPAGPAPAPRTPAVQPVRRPRPVNPQVGTRSHGNTQQIPVVSAEPAREAVGAGVGAAPRGLMLVDPLLRRVGALAVVIALLIPVALALRSGDGADRSAIEPSATELSVASTLALAVAAADADATTTIDIEALPPAIPKNTSSGSADQSSATETDGDGTEAPTATDAATENTTPSASQPPAVEKATSTQSCKQYTVVAGDYWILIAKKVSVSTADLLAINKATAKTALYPGGVICLPANASAPTTAAPTTAAPTTTVKATTTTVKVTTTTAAPAPPVKKTYTRAEVEAIIRYVWPDNLEDEAVRIATRESNLTPGVRNFCCFGLFQIYYSVHKTWLAQAGVTSAEQLYDPLVNAYVAYALYLRAGGWGPWKL